AELIEQITQPRRERTQRVVTARLGRFTVPQQVRCDHSIPFRQLRDDGTPGRRTSGHAMNQQQRLAGPHVPIGNPFAVKIEITHLVHLTRPPLDGLPPCSHVVVSTASLLQADTTVTYDTVGYRSVVSRPHWRTAAIAVLRPRRCPVTRSVPVEPGRSSANIRSLRVSGASSAVARK